MQITPFQGIADADHAALIEKVKRLKLSSLQKQTRKGVTAGTMTVDTPIPFSIHRLWYELHRYVCSTHTAQGANQSASTEAIKKDSGGNPMLGDIMNVRPPEYRPITAGGDNRVYLSGASLNIRRQILATESLLRDTRYDFLFRPGDWCPKPDLQNLDAQPAKDIDSLLESWIGDDKPITILDLSGVPASILTNLIGALLRLLFDSLFWARDLPEFSEKNDLITRTSAQK